MNLGWLLFRRPQAKQSPFSCSFLYTDSSRHEPLNVGPRPAWAASASTSSPFRHEFRRVPSFSRRGHRTRSSTFFMMIVWFSNGPRLTTPFLSSSSAFLVTASSLLRLLFFRGLSLYAFRFCLHLVPSILCLLLFGLPLLQFRLTLFCSRYLSHIGSS